MIVEEYPWRDALDPERGSGLMCTCGHRLTAHTHEFYADAVYPYETRKRFGGCFAAGVRCPCRQFDVRYQDWDHFEESLVMVLIRTE